MFLCDLCDKNFCTEQLVNRHRRITHSSNNQKKCHSCRIKCPSCSKLFSRRNTFHNHLKDDHAIILLQDELNFDNFNEFKQWKLSIEKSESSMYVRTDQFILKDGRKRLFMMCHRSGYYLSRSRQLRKIKSQGTSKIDSTCPSMMIVTIPSTKLVIDKIHVVYWPTHLGHSVDFERRCLTSDERAMIAGKIAEGIPFDKILSDVRESNILDSNVLLTRHDLHNIKSSLKKKQFNIEEIQQRHVSSISINADNIRVLEIGKSWKIRSVSRSNVIYEINKLSENCNQTFCVNKCELCDVCVHMYKCNCCDFVINSNLCKHIHACVRLNSSSSVIQRSFLEMYAIDSIENVIQVNKSDQSEEVRLLRINLQNKIHTLFDYVNSKSYTTEELNVINEKIDSLLQFFTTKIKQNNENIDKQIVEKINDTSGSASAECDIKNISAGLEVNNECKSYVYFLLDHCYA